MSMSTWLRCVSAFSSDTSAKRHSDTRRSASSSSRFDSFPAQAVGRRLRRAVAALLLGLPLLLGLATGAQAQTPECDPNQPDLVPCKVSGTLEFKGFRTQVPSTASNGVHSGFDGTYEVDEGNTIYGKIMLNGGRRAIDKTSAVVVVRASGGTATLGQDYRGISMSPVVHRDYAYTWFSLQIPADGIADDAETFTLEFQDVNDADFKTNGVVDTGTTYPTAEITIRDYTSTDPNDFMPTELIWLSKDEHNVTEGGATRGEVHILNARGVDTTISLTERSGTATSGTDYNAGPYSVTIPAGKTSAAFWIQTMQDEDLESQEAFRLEIDKTSLPTGYEVDTSPGRHEEARVKIDDDEYQLSFALPSYSVREDVGEFVATLNYSRPLPKDSTVKFTYTDISAIGWDPTQPRPAAYDYTQQNAFPMFLKLPAGTEEFTFRVPIHNDNVYEQNEIFKIRGVASEVPFGVPDPSVDVIIKSTDPEVDFQASTFPAHEGRDAVVTFRVVERRTDELQTLRKPTTLHVAATGSSTATAGTDYAAGPWTLTLPKGASKGVLRIPVHADAASDDGETIGLEIKTSGRMLADQSGAALSGHDHIRIRHGSGWASGTARVTIKDGAGGDAKPPMVSIAAGADVTEGTIATFTLTSTPAPPVDIDVSIHVDGVKGGQVADEDRGLQTVSIPSSTGTFALEVLTRVTGRAGEVRVLLMAPKGVSDDWTPDYRVHRESTASLKVNAGSGSPGTPPGVQVPSTQVANVQASAVDDASATVSWDAVEHATSYQVEWEGNGQQFSSAGALPGISGTTATIDHQAQEAMTLTIKVIPAYVDDDGDTQLLDDLAGTTSLDVGPAGGGQGDDPPSACVSDAQWNTVEGYYASNSGKAPNYGKNWYRVLIAYAQERTDRTLPAWSGATARPTTPYTVAEARESESAWSGWTPVREVLECVEAAHPPAPAPLQAPDPEISVSGGGDVTEGAAASFTITASPAPSSSLTVDLTVSQSGDFAASGETGSQQVTIPTGGSVTLDVATIDDGTDESDGSVSVTIDTGTGYTVAAAPNDAASVAVRDDDDPPPVDPVVTVTGGGDITEGGNAVFTVAATPAPTSSLTVTLTVDDDAAGDFLAQGDEGSQSVVIPANQASADLTLTTVQDSDDEPDGAVSATVENGPGYQVGSPDAATVAVGDDDDPPAPVTACVSDAQWNTVEGYYASNSGKAPNYGENWYRVLIAYAQERTGKTLPAWEGATAKPSTPYTVAEAQTSETAWSGWTPVRKVLECVEAAHPPPSAPPQAPDPEISIAGGDAVTEGGTASFTLTANPAPSSAITVTVDIVDSGDFADGGQAGSRTVSIGTGGSATLTVTTDDDNADEPDGSLTATVANGQDYMPSPTRGSASVTVNDDDDAPPETPVVAFTSAASSAGEAAGTRDVTLNLNPAPASGITVHYGVGGTATEGGGGDFTIASSGSVQVTAGSSSATIAIAINDDSIDEASETVELTLTGSDDYDVGATGVHTLTLTDNDDPPPATPVVSIAGDGAVAEGATASFTLTAAPPPSEAITVNVDVVDSGDFANSGQAGSRTAVIGTGGTGTLTVTTDDDTADETDGSLTATVGGGQGYTVAAAPNDAARVAVADDDVPAGSPTLSVLDAEADESDWHMVFKVQLSHLPPELERGVGFLFQTRESTPVSAVAGKDYKHTEGTRRFRQGDPLTMEIKVYTYDDNHDDDGETFELVISHPTGAAIADAVGVGTINNSDPMPAAWLGRFGRAAAEQVLDGIAERVESAGRPGADRAEGFRGTFAGLTFGGGDPAANGCRAGGTPATGRAAGANDSAGPVGDDAGTADACAGGRLGLMAGSAPGHLDHGVAGAAVPGGQGGFMGSSMQAGFGANPAALGGGPAQPGGFPGGAGDPMYRGESAYTRFQQLLLGSRFTYTGAPDAGGGALGFWGRGSQTRFDGREGDLGLDGEVTTAMLGADYARNNWLVGVALTQSFGDGGYRGPALAGGTLSGTAPGDAVPTDGGIEASLTAAIPYAAWRPSERLSLWGAAGYGGGDLTLDTVGGESFEADIDWRMAAAGLRSDLFSVAGAQLALVSDALWAGTGSDRTDGLVATDSSVSRLRLGVEGSRPFTLPGGGSLTPTLEIGARRDGGDAETGFGVEVGGGIAWTDPRLGIKLDLRGRTLISHEDGAMRERGFSASLAYDPRPDTARGLTLELRQDIGGPANGGLDALFANDPLTRRHGGHGADDAGRWTAEMGYGLPAFGGRFVGTPHVGYGVFHGAREIGVGWRLAPEAAPGAPDLSLAVQAVRREAALEPADHRIGIEVRARW